MGARVACKIRLMSVPQLLRKVCVAVHALWGLSIALPGVVCSRRTWFEASVCRASPESAHANGSATRGQSKKCTLPPLSVCPHRVPKQCAQTQRRKDTEQQEILAWCMHVRVRVPESGP